MRNLVVCCDGTWNTPDQKHDGVPTPTNVVKIFNASLEDDGQLKYYHPGVGTEGSALKRSIDGGLGRGLNHNIQSAYNWLCTHYRSGDRIFLFGFSRGAYTVRSLAGFVLGSGLLDLSEVAGPEEAWRRIGTAFDEGYRNRRDRQAWGSHWPTLTDENGAPPDIHFIGVWDTVGAMGVPDDMVLLDVFFDDPKRYRFHDTDLSRRVHHAYHAVALDEVRASFAPTLWRVPEDREGVEQLWFAGNHSDVGGGHPECGLSDIALQWMGEKARACGLRLNDRLLSQLQPNHQGVLHDGLEAIWAKLRTLPRAAPLMDAANVGKSLHPSAWERHDNPPIAQAPYRRTTRLPPEGSWSGDIFARERWNVTGVWLEAGATYRFSASGEWIDKYNRSGPEGMEDGKFQLGELVYRLGDLVAKAEELYRDAADKPESDWWSTRRHEESGWFALTGMIANQADVDGSGTPPSGRYFTIGKGCTLTPERSGYLYCFANDSWRFYENNRGSVLLTVTRTR